MKLRIWCVFVLLASASLVGCFGEPPPAPTNTAKQADPETPGATYGNGNEQKEPFDPIATNGKIFENWPKPKLAIVMTGDQDGYIEPCGCTGRENQKGGIARRHSFFKQLEADGWPAVAVDVGGVVKRFGRQTEIKYQILIEAMTKMGYDAIGFGPKDLRLPVEGLVALAAGDTSPFVSANVDLLGVTQPFRVVEAGGHKIAITSILGAEYQQEINNDQVTFKHAAEALAAIVPKMKSAADYLILLSHATPAESEALAKQFPDFNIVVTAGGAEEPPHELRQVDGTKTILVEVGHKGKYAIVIGLFDDAQRPVRYQRVPLDARFADSREMLDLMVAYQGQLEQLGLAGLEIRPRTHPRATAAGDATGQFVGSAKCGECHKTAFDIWSKSKHAQATHALATATPPRLFDAECLSCHVTGWSPQEYTPFESGFVGMAETPHLVGNGCENCHGPGGAHVAAEAGRDLTLRDQLRQTLRLTRATVELNTCVKCHDDDNDPKFHFDTYWPKVEHKGKK